jgi:hypothetical protein
MTKKAYKEGYADADAGRASRYDKNFDNMNVKEDKK